MVAEPEVAPEGQSVNGQVGFIASMPKVDTVSISEGGGTGMSLPCKSVKERAEALTNFDGCEDVCRGVPLGNILVNAGSILSQARGSAATYKLSRPTTSISTFVSHNWVTRRLFKYFTLVLHFNFDTAYRVVFTMLAVGGAMTGLGLMPTVPDRAYSIPVGFMCRLSFVPMFLGILCFRYEILGRLGFRGPTVFLDKACIDQTDPLMMVAGIKKLGAFIAVSNRMTVVYTDVYLSKLWTVYEVACFLAVHPISALDIAPVTNTNLFLQANLMCYAFNVAVLFARMGSDFYFWVIPLGVAAVLGYMVAARKWARARAAAMERLSTFSIRSCTCAVESDRQLVYDNIAVLMGARGVVPEDAPLREALNAFDARVRQQLPAAFATAFGETCMTYKLYVFNGITFMGCSTMDYLAWLPGGVPIRKVMVYMFMDLFFAFAITPLFFVALERLAGLRLGWVHCREWCLMTAGACTLCLLFLATYNLGAGFIIRAALQSDALFVACAGLVALMTVAAAIPDLAVRAVHALWLRCHGSAAASSASEDRRSRPVDKLVRASAGRVEPAAVEARADLEVNGLGVLISVHV